LDPVPRALAFGAVAAALVLRLAYLGRIDLLPEEAYYWRYAQHLDLGYLDHPPLVAWLIWVGDAAFGKSELGVRIGAFVLSLATAGFGYGLARNAFDAATARWTLLLLCGLPYFFGVGMLMTPDAPLLASWAGALYFLERALLAGRGAAWLGFGACIGFGMLSKYSMALLGAAAVGAVLLDPAQRRWLRRPEPYLGLALALAIFSPVLVWNARHGWASFAFQSARRLGKSGRFGLPWLVGGAALLLTPLGLFAALQALLVRRDGAPKRFPRLARLSAGVPLAVFAAFSLRHGVRLNWTGPLWLVALPLVAQRIAARPSLARIWGATLAALLLLYAVALEALATGALGARAPRLPVGWRELAAEVQAVARPLGGKADGPPLLVGMDHYFIASELGFYAGGEEATGRQLLGRHSLMYERWASPRLQPGRPLVLVSFARDDLEDPRLARTIEGLGPVEEHPLAREGHAIGRFYTRVGRSRAPD
jgi:dolichol-phosphate mannosyltransferase